MARAFRLCKNVSLIGPPGSGKGSYGRMLANDWNVDLWTASTVLRQSRVGNNEDDNDLDSGKLVDCQMVSDVLKSHLASSPTSSSLGCSDDQRENGEGSHYLLDGFPRTLDQIRLMESQWPLANRIDVALYLDVPDSVCTIKMLGRRHCAICGRSCNLHAVEGVEGFFLPPHMPDDEGCPGHEWKRREDDVPEIVEERLRVDRENRQPIVDYYEKEDRLLRVRPYNGYEDLPKIRKMLEKFVTGDTV